MKNNLVGNKDVIMQRLPLRLLLEQTLTCESDLNTCLFAIRVTATLYSGTTQQT